MLEMARNYVIMDYSCYGVVQYSSQSTVSEGGPKNSLKGTSMKFLVLASGAHLGVDAE